MGGSHSLRGDIPKKQNAEVDEPEEEVDTAPNTLDGVIIITDLIDSIPSKLDDASLRRFYEKHRIPIKDIILPTHHYQAHHPLEGYVACNRYMCTAGCVPQFSLFIRRILHIMRLAPTQLHLNG